MSNVDNNRRIVFILGISSDIGKEIAIRYINEGHVVYGTYRKNIDFENKITQSGGKIFYCDIDDKNSIQHMILQYKGLAVEWDIFISAVGDMEPINHFFNCDFDDWERSIHTNCLNQLRILHGLYPVNEKEKEVAAVLFAGGGTNNPFENYSAYCVSKIMLIKMCELLDDETSNLNIFIVGPGIVKTKIHQQTIKNKEHCKENYEKTLEFLNENYLGTSYDDIYNFINWGIMQGKKVTSGRNFSVVHDKWKCDDKNLIRNLSEDKNMYKLRRFGN